jgi:preprotein translocase subunit SecA
MAGRGTDIKLGPGVKEAGGLAIFGTERHESRRVDRQLRGRSGRQGDPGSSQFFVSLEDDLMRLFGSERIASIMDRLGLKEGEVIQHSMITKSIERAQKKVEENHFGTRKRLLEYDDVMNSQREVIYKRRRHALHGERLALDIKNMFEDVSEAMIADHQESRDFQGLRMDMLKVMAMDAPFKEDDFLNKSKSKLTENLFAESYQRYRNKSAAIAERAYPVIKDVYENNSRYELIAIPITDGNKEMNIVTNLKKAYNDKGREVILSLEKGVTLHIIDNAWKEHLREMDELKQSVQNAVYEQKDPLLIYKFESFDLFSKMVARINRDITSFLMKGNLPGQETQVKEAQAPRKTDMSKLKQERTDLLSQASPTKEQSKPAPVRVEKKVGRNDPCPCGSGKKYKSCHGQGES